MYVLVRADLRPGLQMAQAIHAAVDLALSHPEQAAVTPNTIVLAVPDEGALLDWADRLDVPFVLFAEPDLGGEHTALACFHTGEPFAALPLAGKELVMSG